MITAPVKIRKSPCLFSFDLHEKWEELIYKLLAHSQTSIGEINN
tara:strand:+ start:231 stop:362 length:132 start_codon:yes stop_codon:yes gene_type:complete